MLPEMKSRLALPQREWSRAMLPEMKSRLALPQREWSRAMLQPGCLGSLLCIRKAEN